MSEPPKTAPRSRSIDAVTSKIHLLDVGSEEYGDAILCEFGDVTVLVDGAHPSNHKAESGHPSLPDQIGELLRQDEEPLELDLIVVTHAHQDHIGCLPKLVSDDRLRAKWALVADPGFGWGRPADDSGPPAVDAVVAPALAALREEPRTARTPDSVLRTFLADAVTLEDRYITMLSDLEAAGTKIVRHGRNRSTALRAYLAQRGITLRILAPRRADLLVCAERVLGGSDALADRLTRRSTTDRDSLSLYREYVATFAALDELDVQRIGQYVNLQSIVTDFEYRGRKFLFTGDMQMADPQTSDATLLAGNRALLRQLETRGPYDFVKLAHHGSWNGFDEEIHERAGAALLGICAGSGSTHHPAADTLELLRSLQPEVSWARTDRNGQVTFDFSAGTPSWKLGRGRINDPRPNVSDAELTTRPAVVSPAAPAVATRPSGSALAAASGTTVSQSSLAEHVEVVARIPHAETRVTITIEVQPAPRTARVETPAAPTPPVEGSPRRTITPPAPETTRSDLLRVGNGRLSKLVFATDSERLRANVGESEAAAILQAIRDAPGVTLVDDRFSGRPAAEAAALLRRHVAQGVDGVILLGGHDVMASQIVDSLPPTVRGNVRFRDPDDFIVWSDDVYGDLDGDGWPELPISRIPDGKSAALLRAAITAELPDGRDGASDVGVRNVARPFAQGVFGLLGGGDEYISCPLVHEQLDASRLAHGRLYFMLHGSDWDASRFWGEQTQNDAEAVNLRNVPDRSRSVVFTGCCWGALTVDTRASRVTGDRPVAVRTPDASLALRFLAAGCAAFVGCTGAHYSPSEEPYDYFGAPLHRAFWDAYLRGAAPAVALLEAKRQYLLGIPHRRGHAFEAIELKIARQYTCLGLGW